MSIRKVPPPLHPFCPVKFQVPLMLPLEPRTPVSVSVLLTGVIDVVETVITKLPVCTPFALPERVKVALPTGLAAKQAIDPIKLNLVTLTALLVPCDRVAVKVNTSILLLSHA